MLPPEEYANAASHADWHVQIMIEGVVFAAGEARVSGRVVRVFRGPRELRGTRMMLQVGIQEADAPPDGTTRFPIESICVGHVLEALVDDMPSGPEVVMGLCTLIASPTETPQLPLDFKSAANRRRKTKLAILAALVAVLLLAALAFVAF